MHSQSLNLCLSQKAGPLDKSLKKCALIRNNNGKNKSNSKDRNYYVTRSKKWLKSLKSLIRGLYRRSFGFSNIKNRCPNQGLEDRAEHTEGNVM